MFSDEKARARIVSADVLVSYHVSEKGFSLKEALRITERVYLGGGLVLVGNLQERDIPLSFEPWGSQPTLNLELHKFRKNGYLPLENVVGG